MAWGGRLIGFGAEVTALTTTFCPLPILYDIAATAPRISENTKTSMKTFNPDFLLGTLPDFTWDAPEGITVGVFELGVKLVGCTESGIAGSAVGEGAFSLILDVSEIDISDVGLGGWGEERS
jgi:hypothetical protein